MTTSTASMRPFANDFLNTRLQLVSIGDALEPGNYRFHSQFPKAVNFVSGDRLACLVTEAIGPGPLNLVVRGIEDLNHFKNSENKAPELKITDTSVTLETSEEPLCKKLSPDFIYDSRLNSPCSEPARIKTRLEFFKETLIREAPPQSLAFLLDPSREAEFKAGFEQELLKRLKTKITKFVTASNRDDLVAGVEALTGLGLGLTPSGDDFIAGYLLGLHLQQRLVPEQIEELTESIQTLQEAYKSNHLFSANFVRVAAQGHFFEPALHVGLWLITGQTPSNSGVPTLLHRLLSHGQTSGADLAVGMLLTFN